MNLPDPRKQPGPSFDDDVGLFTVRHKVALWTLGILAIVGWALIGWRLLHG